ncbi:MAG: hypothetical protein K5857_09100 [Lachnospiraceae bacterium]|nr:hypothetical protein [Lachnospiraceae bacterium]
MRNRRLAALLVFTVFFSLIFNDLAGIRVYGESKLNLSEGTGKGPSVEIIRVDDEGNEIPADETPEEDAPTTSENMSYEEDLSGYSFSPEGLEMTTVNISSVDDLIQLAKDCRLDTWSRDKNVVLTTDLTLDGSGFKYIPTFGGIFDGGGHTISGLTVSDAESYTGLFCITQESALIKDLNVEGSLVPSGKQMATGGIVGDNYGAISNCTFTGNIDGYDYSGGIAGYNEQTGTISNCKAGGYVLGMHFTGGIAGYNLGTISGCTNECKINITSVDETVSLKDLNIDQYADKIKNLFGDNNKQDSTNIINSTVDTGGICGYSQGVIMSCVNNALVGYEHVGYNVGGIVGRQNGYVDLCVNNGEVYGRKDVGGIVGQAEPYVIIDITEDIIGQLTSNMNTLHDLVNVTLNDAGDESNLITARLNMVKNFTDRALNDTSYLANETENFINDVMDTGTEVVSRIDYAMEESVKGGGVLDKTRQGFSDASTAASNLTRAVDDLDLYKYMNEAEKVSYNQAKQNISDGSNDYQRMLDEHRNNEYNYYYIKSISTVSGSNLHRSVSSDIVFVDGNNNPVDLASLPADKSAYNGIRVMRRDLTTDPPTLTPFPSGSGEYAGSDEQLNTEASAAAEAAILANAESEFKGKYGVPYPEYLASNVTVVEQTISSHLQEMSEQTRKDAKYAIDYTRQTMNDFAGAVDETRNIVSGLNSRPDIKFPKLSGEYQSRSNSLVANIQGMSDNLGFLNNEMNSSNQQLVDDMIKVNDQFNIIMLLIADAIDGVLDADYTDVYQDNSLAVAEDCTDATIADSVNYGVIHGDIDTSGIAGTMAIEYDFDLESDVTGIKEAAKGTTYRTKCVLRRNKNEGYIEGVKNYVGGMCGLQEMGTILHCQNYGKLKSNSGDYVGGISGQSLSTIHDSYTKGILDGKDYIGGITGMGYDIRGCYSLPTIIGTGTCHGGIAGDNSPDGRIYSNYFVSDEEAGIDRVSYSGKAEPISYGELTAIEGIPVEFSTIRVSFILDGETIDTENYNYGDTIDSLPLELSDGEYIKWDWENSHLDDLRYDTELVGETTRYVTTLAGLQLRPSGQSAVLADGRFTQDDMLSSVLINDKDPNILERWKLTIPNDSQTEHLIRYCPPDGVSDVKIYILNGNEETEAELTKMGKYETFTAAGNEVEFLIEDVSPGFFKKYLKYEIGGGALILAAAIALIASKKADRRRAKKAKAAGADEDENDIIDIDLDKAD